VFLSIPNRLGDAFYIGVPYKSERLGGSEEGFEKGSEWDHNKYKSAPHTFFIISKGAESMFNKVDLSYIEKTEKYIENNRESIDSIVFQFLQQCCIDERKMISLAEEFNNTKGILKAPKAKV